MAISGYSATPLLKKLGIKLHMKVLLLHAPDNYFSLLEADILNQLIKGRQIPDFIHLFAKDIAAFKKGMIKILPIAKKNTAVIIWISWYKKTAGIATDLNDAVIRNCALQNNLVDIKVCAVSEQWSGLKLVVPVARRRSL